MYQVAILGAGDLGGAVARALTTAGLVGRGIPQTADRPHRLVQVNARVLDRVARRNERRIESAELAQNACRPGEALGRRLRRVVEQRQALGHPRLEPLGVLQPAELGAQRLLLALVQARGVQLA